MLDRRTKIVATIGPAQDPAGALERLLDGGVDVLRVNLSHATPRAQAARVRRARAHRPDVAVLADLGGPKLRLGDLPTDIKVDDGETVVLGGGGVPVADPSLFERVRPGDPVYIADGTIALVAAEVRRDRVVCRVQIGGTLRSRKGINLPHDTSSLPALTDKDRADLADIGVLSPDFVALSYVRHERDIAEARGLTDLPLVAKIEKQQALEAIDAIIAASDAIMVARGDLGVEMPIERVPAAQKRVIRAANKAGRPVITATQMLVSMVTNPLPTRAEVTDVANAVLDGTDAVMLSEETAIGHDPPGVVQMMTRLLAETEPMLSAHRARSLQRGDRARARRRPARRRSGRHGGGGTDADRRERPVPGGVPPAPADSRVQPGAGDDAAAAARLGRAPDRRSGARRDGSVARRDRDRAPVAARRIAGRLLRHRRAGVARRAFGHQHHHVLNRLARTVLTAGLCLV